MIEMPPLALSSWIELWIVSLLPVVFYLLTVYYAVQLRRKPSMTTDFPWRWSFLYIQFAVVGAMLIRMRSLVLLWWAGRAGAWAVVDPELIVAAWCIGMGLFLHVLLLEHHPIWAERGGPVRKGDG